MGLRLRLSPGLWRFGPLPWLGLALRLGRSLTLTRVLRLGPVLRLGRSLRLAPVLRLGPALRMTLGLWMTLGLRMSPAPGVGLVHRRDRAGTGWCAPALAVTSRQIPGHDPVTLQMNSMDTLA